MLRFWKEKRNQKEEDNRGLTLVEVLIAMAILSFGVIPILYVFISSTKFNFKAQRIQQATDIAQTAMENMKALGMTKEILDNDFTSGAPEGVLLSNNPNIGNSRMSVDPTFYSMTSASGVDTYQISDIIYNANKGTYQLEMTLESCSSDISTFTGTSSLASYHTMNKTTDAIFADSLTDSLYVADEGALAEARDYVAAAYKTEADSLGWSTAQKSVLPGVAGIDPSNIWITRTVHLNILDASVGVTVDYELTKYRWQEPLNTGAVAASYSEVTSAYGLSSVDLGSIWSYSTDELQNVYFMFIPRYGAYNTASTTSAGSILATREGSFVDQISVDFQATHPVNLYLFKQYHNTSYTPLTSSSVDAGNYRSLDLAYSPIVTISNSPSLIMGYVSGSATLTVMDNLGYCVVDTTLGTTEKSSYNYLLNTTTSGDVVMSSDISGTHSSLNDFRSTLTNASSDEVLYDIEINVYENGTSYSEGTPLATLTGTVLMTESK